MVHTGGYVRPGTIDDVSALCMMKPVAKDGCRVLAWGRTWRPALDDRVVNCFASEEDFDFPPLPPVDLEDIWDDELG